MRNLFVVLLILVLLLPFATAEIIWGNNPTNAELIIVSNVPYCYEQSGTFYWYEKNAIVPAFSDCYRSDGEPKRCCPSGYDCVQTSGKYKCKNSGITSCSEYTKETCGNFVYGVAVDDVESKTQDGYCSAVIPQELGCNKLIKNCRCLWDSEKNKCNSDYNVTIVCGESPELVSGHCILNLISATDCIDRQKVIKWTAQWIGTGEKDSECVSETREVPCLSAELSAISTASIIIAIVLIIIFYTLFSRRKKKQAMPLKSKKRKARA